MKIRNGFVSNSSSSSFVCIAKPGVVKEAIEKEKDVVTKQIADRYLNKSRVEKITLDGNQYEMWHFEISTECFAENCDFDNVDYDSAYNSAYDKWTIFTDKLAKLPNVVIRDECM